MTDQCRKGHPFDEQNAYVLPRKGHGDRQCRACQREAARRYRVRYPERVVASLRASDHQAKARASGKERARHRVMIELRAGRLVRLPCQRCGDAKSQAHHFAGYEPQHHLTVTWLCQLCHMEVHRVEA